MSPDRSLIVPLLALVFVCAGTEARDESLAAWNDTSTEQSISSVVNTVRDISHANCIAPEDVPTATAIFPGRNAYAIATAAIAALLMQEMSKTTRIVAFSNEYRKRALRAYTVAHGLYFTQTGLASWYGLRFHHRRTANGERFDMNGLTAAHQTLPLNSRVRVTNLHNERSVVVRVNDRGPYAAGRIIDLSAEAARQLGFKEQGVARVRIEMAQASEAETQGTPGR